MFHLWTFNSINVNFDYANDNYADGDGAIATKEKTRYDRSERTFDLNSRKVPFMKEE